MKSKKLLGFIPNRFLVLTWGVLVSLLIALGTPVYAEVVPIDIYPTQAVTNAEVTIEGYLTGPLNTSGSAFVTDSKTNLALAASPDAAAKDTIPVQLPTALRAQFNLVDHPELKGKLVRITGMSERYMGRPGIKSTKSIELIEPAPTDETQPPVEEPQPPVDETQPPVEQPAEEPQVETGTPIAQVRAGQKGTEYTVTGKIISAVNGWGGNGFYIQGTDGAGLYVYPGSALGYKMGDTVQLTGILGDYNGELQLTKVSQHQPQTLAIDTPTVETTIPQLTSNQQSTLASLKNVTVGDIQSDNFQTSTFTVTDAEGKTVEVRLDNRTGIKTVDLLGVINKGDKINLTAILSTFNGNIQLKPFALDQFEVVEKAVIDPSQATSVTVADIQGASHQSPLVNKVVTVKDVVVTYVAGANSFYVQDVKPDGNPLTSDGINIYAGNLNPTVKVGDVISIVGVVEEYVGRGYNERYETDLTITQIRASQITTEGTADVPAPIVLGVDRMIPADIIDNDGFAQFDPDQDALDFWESVEGMVVAVDDSRILGPLKNKEIYVTPAAGQASLNNVGGINLRPDGNNTNIIPLLLKNGKQIVKSGDYFTGRIAGPVTYSYTNYKVYVDDATLPPLHEGSTVPETTTIVPSEDKLTIASYNIENFSANSKSTSNAKVERIAKSFVSDLHSPDIIGLIEVQDNNGATNDGTTDASQSAARLIAAITALGGPEYIYADIAPENNQDGGQEGGNIRVGFLYNPARVSLSDKPVGTATQAVAWENGELNLSLGRIDPTNSAWAAVRKTLAAEFVFKGEKVVVIANHLNSKRGDNGLYGKIQPVVFGSEEKRHVLAQLIADFTQAGIAQNPNANIVMLGDFNDYEFTKTIQILETGGMANLVSRHDAADRFSYFYNGNNQSLDNMLVSTNLLDRYSFDMVHVNSAFMEQHGRASDHDPLLVQLNLTPTTEPEKTEPEVTEPEKTEPEKTEPEVTEPEKTEPEKTEPEKTEPGVTEPEKTEPDKQVPDTNQTSDTKTDKDNASVTDKMPEQKKPQPDKPVDKPKKPEKTPDKVPTGNATVTPNKNKKVLPRTGEDTSYVLVFVGVALLGAGLVYYKKRS